MCGIVGAWQLDGQNVDATAVREMRDTLIHRGPSDAGLWVDGPVGLGHRRLSIIDLSEAGRMPMSSRDGRVQAVFNGEVYNFRALRAELEALGHAFFSETDSEVVLRAYEPLQWDVCDRNLGWSRAAHGSRARRGRAETTLLRLPTRKMAPPRVDAFAIDSIRWKRAANR